jgi:hypothetical protein
VPADTGTTTPTAADPTANTAATRTASATPSTYYARTIATSNARLHPRSGIISVTAVPVVLRDPWACASSAMR